MNRPIPSAPAPTNMVVTGGPRIGKNLFAEMMLAGGEINAILRPQGKSDRRKRRS